MKKQINNDLKKILAAVACAGMILSGCAGGSDAAKADSSKAEVSTSASVAAASEEGDTEDVSDVSSAASKGSEDTEKNAGTELVKDENAVQIDGLEYEGSMEPEYAGGFAVHYYNDGYKVIEVRDDADYLIIPEGKDAPDGLDDDIRLLYQPLDDIYIAATSAMALFDSIDALGNIKFSGTKADGWYVDNAVSAMNDGDMTYAGKYSAPDYEMLLDSGCDLAVESTMILHSPKVQEMLETIGIPVFVDRSSYEEHPLGRTEWIKVYAAMLNKEEEAEEFFKTQTDIIDEMKDYEKTDLKVAFFYVDSNGSVNVRNANDYIPKMIEMGGGEYVYNDVFAENAGSASTTVSMEQFYDAALDADYLIYNASIDKPITSVDDLIAKNELFAEFKAVKEGHVYSTGKGLYQATDKMANFINDIHLMLSGGEKSDMSFIYPVE